jgi:hypothetical protein
MFRSLQVAAPVITLSEAIHEKQSCLCTQLLWSFHMGIALLGLINLTGLSTPLHSLAHRWMPARRRSRQAPQPDARGSHHTSARPTCTSGGSALSHASRPGPAPSAKARPLRVIRTIDARQPGRHLGRVLISGRMADVCAELDRLAALEAAATPHH